MISLSTTLAVAQVRILISGQSPGRHGFRFVGVLVMRALLVGVYIRTLDL